MELAKLAALGIQNLLKKHKDILNSKAKSATLTKITWQVSVHSLKNFVTGATRRDTQLELVVVLMPTQ